MHLTCIVHTNTLSNSQVHALAMSERPFWHPKSRSRPMWHPWSEVTVTVTDNLLIYSSYRKAPPFPLITWTVMSTCLELPYMKCCPRPSLHVMEPGGIPLRYGFPITSWVSLLESEKSDTHKKQKRTNEDSLSISGCAFIHLCVYVFRRGDFFEQSAVMWSLLS